jgi:predicted Zn-dependent protease with MMP-like domain
LAAGENPPVAAALSKVLFHALSYGSRRAGRDTLETVQTADGEGPGRSARIRRRDRHGRGLRGVLVPEDVPLHRTRAERFDDLVLQALARLEPQWEAHLSGVEFAVEEIPPADTPAGGVRGPVPLSRLDPGPERAPGSGAGEDDPRPGTLIKPGTAEEQAAGARQGAQAPPRIVVYRRPLMARADGDEDLGELVFDVVVEEFARLLGIDPKDVDPGYADGE